MKFSELLKTTNLSKLTATLSLIAVLAIAITVTALYSHALEQHGRLLTANVSSQIMLMRTMQELEQNEADRDQNSDGWLIYNAINYLQLINEQADVTGNSSEMVVAIREADRIVYLLAGGHGVDEHFSVAFNSKLAEAMRRALLGETGTVTGLDHHGHKVLAAYQFMPEYGLGIVSKIDIDEILTPYLLVILFASIIAIIFVFVGAYAFAITVRPFYVNREKMEKRLRKQHEIMSFLAEKNDIDPCDMQRIFEDITEAASEGLNVARASVWLFNTDLTQMHCADLYDRNINSHDLIDTLNVSDFPVYFETLLDNHVIDAGDVYSDHRTQELISGYLRPNGIKAMLDVPIQINGAIIGVLCQEHKGNEHTWNQEDQNFARSIADHISMSMSNCQRNKAEQYLKESEQRYELAVTGSNDGLWDWDLSTNRVYRSPQYKKMLGYDDAELKDDYESWFDYLHDDDRKRVEEAVSAHQGNADIPYDIEYRLLTKSGQYRWFRCRGSALRDENGKPFRMSGSITDITDLKSTQDSLTRFKQTLGEISENIFMFDPETLVFFYVNKSAIDETGYSEEELMKMTPMDLKPEFNEKSFREMISALILKPEETLSFETVQQCKSGEQVPVEVNLQYIAPVNAAPRFVFVIRNISERRNAEIESYIQRTMLEHIYQVQEDFISGENRRKVFERLLNGILDITESEFGLIGEIVYPQDEPPFLRTRHITNIAWNDEMRKFYQQHESGGLEFRELDNLLGAVITSASTVISNDPANDERSSGLPEGHPRLESFMGIPLKLGNDLTGIIGIANRTEGYSDDILKRLQPLLLTCTNLLEAEKTEELRNSMENALRNSEEKASTVLATVADGIITINDKGLMESFNHAAEGIFGYDAHDVIGENISMLMPEPYESEHDTYMANYHQTGDAKTIGHVREVKGKRKDGTVFPIELAVSEIHLGTERKYTGVVRDISERKQAEAALISARDEAEQANRTKSEFLSSMSHELRTPLNAIMGFAQILQFDTSLSDVQQKHARTIHNAGSLLLDLINDVLDLAKIEAGRIDLSIESIRLQDVLQDCFKLIRPLAEKRGIALSFDSNDMAEDPWVRADSVRLKQVLLNLLSNAIKYNKNNGSVSVRFIRVKQGFHQIQVADTGRGIKQQDIQSLFQPFNRLGAQHGDIEGTGIGLVITRKLVELMGGTIGVESEPGQGSVFMVDLPLAKAVTVADGSGKLLDKPLEISQIDCRILVAEDNLTNQELMALQLHTLGYQADIVSNGKQAMALLHKHDYDLLLTDIHMPEMDGYELTQSVRNSATGYKNIIIIAITANAAADEASRCIENGMNDYLPKPVNINELQSKLQHWLPGVKDAGRREQVLEPPGKHPAGNAGVVLSPDETKKESAIDVAVLEHYIGSDLARRRRFFTLFLESSKETMNAMSRAAKEHSPDDMENASHKLKSPAQAIGATRLSTLCQHVETAAANKDWRFIEDAMPEIEVAMAAVRLYIKAFLAGAVNDELQVRLNFNDALIVDDDHFALDLITLRLASLGVDKVMTVQSGAEALSYIDNTPVSPSVMLLGLNMPGLDGVEVLQRLAGQSYAGSIILMSAGDTRLLQSAEKFAHNSQLKILGSLEKPVTIKPLAELLLKADGKQSSVR